MIACFSVGVKNIYFFALNLIFYPIKKKYVKKLAYVIFCILIVRFIFYPKKLFFAPN